MSEKRQKIPVQLALLFAGGGEAPVSDTEGTETLRTERWPENPAVVPRLMEELSTLATGR